MSKEVQPIIDKNEIIVYQPEGGEFHIEVRVENETVWLTQAQMAELFSTSRTNIVEHIGHIYEENELDADSTCRKFRQVQIEGSRKVNRQIPFYNLDMILSLGYRVKSAVATKFRRWANQVLKVKLSILSQKHLGRVENETIWLTQELDEKSTCAKIAQVRMEGERAIKPICEKNRKFRFFYEAHKLLQPRCHFFRHIVY